MIHVKMKRGVIMPIRKTNRKAAKPLDLDAVDKANRELWKRNSQLLGRKLTMDRGDYLYRQEWMDAYIKHLGGKKSAIGGSKKLPKEPLLDEMKNIDGMCQRERTELDQKLLWLSIAEEAVRKRQKRVDDYRKEEFMTERPTQNRGVQSSMPPAYSGDDPRMGLAKFATISAFKEELQEAIKSRDKAESAVERTKKKYKTALKKAEEKVLKSRREK